jgi:DNA-binding MarR family transcriptional regulator
MLMAEANYLLDGLEKKGYIDSIDDENGNEVVFLTTKGKNDMALINKDVDKLLHNIILN